MEVLMHLQPKSHYEKLLWERALSEKLREENKNLKMEVGFLKSEMDELKDNKELRKLSSYKEELKALRKKVRELNIDNEKLQRDLLIEKGLLTVSNFKND